MADTGRPRKPTALKVLAGERREARLNRRAPQPAHVRPVMPADMTAEAKRVWRRIMRDFGDTGILTRVDLGVLRIYCEAEARYVEAANLLAQAGPLARDRKGGGFVKNPLHQIVRDNADLMVATAGKLGFTPSSRESLTIPETSVDPLDAWEATAQA